MAENKPLTTQNVRYDHEILSQRYQIIVKGQADDYELFVDRWFTKTKINAFLDELRKKAVHLGNKGLQIQEVILPYMYLLVLKHFTSLDIPEDFASQIIVLEGLADTGMFEQIVKQLPKQEVNDLFEEVIKLNDRIEEVKNELFAYFTDNAFEFQTSEFEQLLME